MTENEVRLAVDSLRSSLEKSTLSWVLREVDETLRLGKPIVRTVMEEKSGMLEGPDAVHLRISATSQQRGFQTRRRAIVPTTEPYSIKEQLELLLDAIKRTAIATMEMQSAVVQNLALRDEKSTTAVKISFEREGSQSSLPFASSTGEQTNIYMLRDAVRALRERAK